jgi:hypothetical protein
VAERGVVQGSIKGEKFTGFEKRGAKGPFECGNCEYFKDDSCNEDHMMVHSKQARNPNGTVKVKAEDCCEYVDRVGRK